MALDPFQHATGHDIGWEFRFEGALSYEVDDVVEI